MDEQEFCKGTRYDLVMARGFLWIEHKGQREVGGGEVDGYKKGPWQRSRSLHHSVDHGLHSAGRRKPSEMLLKVFLRYNSHTIKSTLSKYTM